MWKNTDDTSVIKSFLIVGLNIYLFESGYLKDVLDIVLFNAGLALVGFGLYLKRVRKIYERNLKWLPSIADSIPQGHTLRIENEMEKRKAMQVAIRLQEWESFNW